MIRRVAQQRVPIGARTMLVTVAGAVLATAVIFSLAPSDTHVAAAPPSLSHRLGPRGYAIAIPLTWLSAPIPDLREGDVVDLLGTRPGERATATEVADRLRLMSIDERTMVLQVTSDDAAAIAAARARGVSLVPILRAAR